jgi:hypothetical protein
MTNLYVWAALVVSIHACYTMLQRRAAARIRAVRAPVVKDQTRDRGYVIRRHNAQSWD